MINLVGDLELCSKAAGADCWESWRNEEILINVTLRLMPKSRTFWNSFFKMTLFYLACYFPVSHVTRGMQNELKNMPNNVESGSLCVSRTTV